MKTPVNKEELILKIKSQSICFFLLLILKIPCLRYSGKMKYLSFFCCCYFHFCLSIKVLLFIKKKKKKGKLLRSILTLYYLLKCTSEF